MWFMFFGLETGWSVNESVLAEDIEKDGKSWLE